MLQPTRTCFALAAGSLVLGLVGAGVAVADENPPRNTPGHGVVLDDDDDYDDEEEWDDEEDGEDEEDGDGPGRPPHHRYATGKVVSRGPLNVRSGPTTHSSVVEKVYPDEKVSISCKKHGERVGGNDLWYHLPEDDGWVAARWVKNLSPVKWCH
ncbi:SH3 domain-containing protein [Streptomyces antimicrobicus]|uniref:SH3 domain-containing protein n=1 Tax=Streptomyces antimicrobicus TaxID=2883108 RepID=A0ABS8B1F0_9ACTN|nr:SH3 domain-containing protein [Streptomyces antimicrobicus]MCB5178433.1 SH3 domain-containing protein [Streptomyces antimicrobicus]